MSDIFNGQVSGENIEKVCFKRFTIKAVNLRVPKDYIMYALASMINVFVTYDYTNLNSK
jgi:hypothetical protein